MTGSKNEFGAIQHFKKMHSINPASLFRDLSLENNHQCTQKYKDFNTALFIT